MEPRERATPLKQTAKRTVERTAGDEVVKRFHSPGRLDRWLDRTRAKSEFEMLRELSARNLPVPRPIEVRRSANGWEISTEWIEGAVPLANVLAGRAVWPAPPEAIARALGESLARAHGVGLDHPDLHGGNVLVGPGARAWLVDVHGARILARPSPKVAVRDLVQLAADTRERMPVALRARVLTAWRATLPVELASALQPAKQLAAIVERAARVQRRAAVARARTRWTRNSSACRARKSPDFDGFIRAELADRDPHAIRTSADIVLENRSERELLAHWYVAARLESHGVRAARPLVFSRSLRAWAAFGLPAGARPASRATGLGELAGTLFDRGLVVPGLESSALFVDDRGDVWLGPTASLRDLHESESPRLLGEIDAFVNAQLSGPRERERVRAALEASRHG